MKRQPRIGDSGNLTFTVGPAQTINIADSAELAVLSTPSLIWFLEHAAREALAPLLDEGETSVGVKVEVEHLAATPLGHEVICRARVVHVEGPTVTFQVSADDRRETIARGLHRRRVVSAERFNAYVRKKLVEKLA